MNPGTLIVSLDFELLWGMIGFADPSAYTPNVLGGRKAVPALLELFRKHGIHATWATVGFLFAENKDELRAFSPPPALRPSYRNPALNTYAFAERAGDDETAAPTAFAPSLIRLIASYPHQEIASHTFAHTYCREEGQTRAAFHADTEAMRAIAAAKGFPVTSAVLPRNQSTPEAAAVLAGCGFRCYRDEERDWIHRAPLPTPVRRLLRLCDVYLPLTGQGGYIPEKRDGILTLTGSRMFKPIRRSLGFLEGLKLRRIKRQMLHAAKNGLTFHFWWHPHNIGLDTDAHLKQLEDIFSYYDRLKDRYGMRSRTMKEVADALPGADA